MSNVVTLFKNVTDFEILSDYEGVLFTPFDDYGHWNSELVRELKAAGYNVDANELFS